RQGGREADVPGRVAHPPLPGGPVAAAPRGGSRRRPRDPLGRRGGHRCRRRAANGGMMLERILDSTRRRLPDLVARADDIVRQATEAPPPPPLADALRGDRLAVIGEVKRRSPSRGPLDLELDPVAQATRYAVGGAAGISVLTEPEFFSGSDADLAAVAVASRLPVLRKDFSLEPGRARGAAGGAAGSSVLTEPQVLPGSGAELGAVPVASRLPGLRKDFTLEPVEVWEARALGASAVLLIVAALDDSRLRRLIEVAAEAGLDALVEVHTPDEAARAVDAGAAFVGGNNRDLHTFDVDLATAA